MTGWGTCGLVCFQGRGEMLAHCVALVEMDGADILKSHLKAGKPGQWHPTTAPLPGESRGQRSLVRCSPWGREESDTTQRQAARALGQTCCPRSGQALGARGPRGLPGSVTDLPFTHSPWEGRRYSRDPPQSSPFVTKTWGEIK